MLRMDVFSATINDYQRDNAEEANVISVVNSESERDSEDAGNDDIEDSAEQELLRRLVRVEMPSETSTTLFKFSGRDCS